MTVGTDELVSGTVRRIATARLGGGRCLEEYPSARLAVDFLGCWEVLNT
jgi:hypothetical protein